MYIVFDLELNSPFKINRNTRQLEKGIINPNIPMEIIEIGAVKLNDNLEIIDNFRIYVKPQVYKILHPKVKKVTKIAHEDLEFAFPFEQCFRYFKNWIDSNDIVMCSWGNSDIKDIKRNCSFYNIDIDWIKECINVQRLYSECFNIPHCVSLKEAIATLNIETNQSFHNALADSIYTSKVFKELKIRNINDYIIDLGEKSDLQ